MSRESIRGQVSSVIDKLNGLASLVEANLDAGGALIAPDTDNVEAF